MTGNKSEQLKSNPNSLYNTASLSRRKIYQTSETTLKIATSVFALQSSTERNTKYVNSTSQFKGGGGWTDLYLWCLLSSSVPLIDQQEWSDQFYIFSLLFHCWGSLVPGPSWVWSEYYCRFILTALWQHFAMVNTKHLDLHS